MGHDKNIYLNPEEFNPQRLLTPTPELSPRNFVFGFGRRICPGRLMAEQSIFLTIAKTVAVFGIAGPKEREGCPIILDPGLLSHPHHSEAAIKPRNPRCDELILEVGKMLPRAESSLEELGNITRW